MTPQSKKTLCLFTTIQGHQSIAAAIQETFQDEFNVHLFFARDPSFDVYVALYKSFPRLLSIPFTISKNAGSRAVIQRLFYKRYKAAITDFCEKHQPDVCIGTFCAYNEIVSQWSAAHHVPFINVVSDPRTIHPFLIAGKANANIVFDEEAVRRCQRMNKKAKIEECGWFVRNVFEEKYDRKKVLAKLHLQENVLTFLITSGSEGTEIIQNIFPFLMRSKTHLQIVVACGSNEKLLKKVEKFSQSLAVQNSHVKVLPIGYTPELYLYMQAADLVIGKAGPNTIFESVATLTPFFATTHISGQENGNLDIIREYELGYVQENPAKAAKLLQHIIEHPVELEKFQEPLQKMAEKNKMAKEKLVKIVKEFSF